METYKGIKVTENNKAWLTYLAKEDAKAEAFKAGLVKESAKGYSLIGNMIGIGFMALLVISGILLPFAIIALVF